MKNFIQNGDYIDVPGPSGGVSSGDLVKIGQLIGVAVVDADEGEMFSMAMTGVFELPKDGDAEFEIGDYVYFDGTECTDDDEDDLVGVAVMDAAEAAPVVRVRLLVGVAGPQGDEGPTGPTGPSGPTGPTGPSGG